MILELSHQYEEALGQCDVVVMPTITHTAPKFLQQKDSDLDSQRGEWGDKNLARKTAIKQIYIICCAYIALL